MVSEPVRAGLLGHPVAHSRSPRLFAAAWSEAGLAGAYTLVDVPPAGLGDAVSRVRHQGWVGVNVTIPHKQAICAHLDGLDPSARAVGAVNCVVRTGRGRLVGHNTDGGAFVASLRSDAGLDPAGLRVVLLGAGGAARALAAALSEAGAHVLAAARRAEVAAALPGVAGVLPWAHPLPPSGVDLLVNCTPLGMAGGPDEGPGADSWGHLEWDRLAPGACVADLVYVPATTPLLAAAARRGHPTLGGLPMLVGQAEAAYRLWTGSEPPLGAMARAASGPEP